MTKYVGLSHFPRQCYSPMPHVVSFVINIRQNTNNNVPYCVLFGITPFNYRSFLFNRPREAVPRNSMNIFITCRVNGVTAT
jgi:16S rRNA A1518/A1519 N6-dimethyltransferase RsmA/KsgA/DIM1 with predicted DNA glycosylase/AP lyase activity